MSAVLVRHRSELPTSIIEQVHRLRHRTFAIRLGWQVESRGDWEIDRYDEHLDPLFGVCLDGGEVVGCWRLLPTTGDCLLKDVFCDLMHGEVMPEQPDIWEATRFAVGRSGDHPQSLGALRVETKLLIASLIETGMSMTLTKIVAVSDLRFERVLSRSGLITHRFGPPLPCGKATAVAGWFDVTEENLTRVRPTAPVGVMELA